MSLTEEAVGMAPVQAQVIECVFRERYSDFVVREVGPDGAVGPDLAHDEVRVALAEHALDDLRLHGCHANCFLGERHLVSFAVHCNAAECVPAAITAWSSALPAAALRLHSNARSMLILSLCPALQRQCSQGLAVLVSLGR